MVSQVNHAPQALSSRIAGVRFYEVGKVYHFSHDHLPDLRVGDFVVVETARGVQLGQVMQALSSDPDDSHRDYKPILRQATPTDLMSQKLWKSKEVEALVVCREKAAEMGGFDGAKFVAAQYNFDGSLLTFLFTAEDKLNTNKLRAALQRSIKARLELRQVGPRDVAKLLGGMGACGIPRCCSTFLTDFSPISIKMAKAQGISLNPSEITGMCGRLRCCLIYEYEQYVEARKVLPKRNKRVGTPHGEGKVIDVHPLKDAVSVLVEDTQYMVQREDLIPLEEWEALKSKAEAGCSKGEDGPCDCGARGPAEETDEETPAVSMGQVDLNDENLPPETGPSPDHDAARSSSRRSRSRRNRNKRASGNSSERQPDTDES